MSYQRINIILGWVVWAIATLVYLNTIEPTASFWDCGEFIATAYKLEIGHPPGAPFFMILGRFFSMWAGPESAAMMINVLSGLSSSFTILFLFWTITHLGKKLANVSAGDFAGGKQLAVLGAGVVGALAYTFSDSFWFSAVEGEVYAMSSLFTAMVFWAILKWENVADEPYADRWLILIAYLMGLSIGVHLLNLLAIPAMVFVYYFRKYKVDQKGLIIAGIAAVLILGVVQGGIIPYTIVFATVFEKMFVNGFGMAFNSGVYIYIILLVAAIGGGIYYTRMKGMIAANTIITCVSVILIGYSSFAVIMIRSSANPPMDENNPENVFALLSYLNREQYGDRPLFFGQQFNSPLDNQKPYKDGKPVWFQDKKSGEYIISDDKKESVPNYASEFKTLFPRMYSPDKKHVREYKSWTDFKGKRKRYKTVQGEVKQIPFPTFGENVKFFVNYQIGWMYLRYFMWNFAGRQNDIQGHGNSFDGNWVSGIPFIDNARLGDQEALPKSISDNPANNKFYLLPLLLGIIGLVYQFSKHGKDATVVALLFFFTGLAIVVYLNQYPIQPRERDYAYAGSFYAYAIWIGLGVYALFDWTREYLSPSLAAGIMSVICLLGVPGIMAKEGWDDHDRSDTYTARDFAKNYLESCAPNAVLFTNGDNDTFPLWYVQEVEEFRTDVRVINLSLLNTDWYINQMRRKAYDSEKVPFNMSPDKYRQGTRDFVYIFEKGKGDIHLDIKEAIDFISDDSKGQRLRNGKSVPYFPTKNFSLKVDSAQMIANGTVKPENADKIVDRIKWKFPGNHVMKNDMMIFDLIANNNWERPVYFAITTGNRAYVGLQDHFRLEGLAYRLVPIKTPKGQDGQIGLIDTEIMYDNLMNKFNWGGMDKGNIYLNENNRRMCMNLRNNFARLARALVAEGEKDKALAVLDRCVEVMPEENVPYNFFMIPVVQAYVSAGAIDKAAPLVEKLYFQYENEMNYYLGLDIEDYRPISKSKVQQAISILYQLNEISKRQKMEIQPQIDSSFNDIQVRYGEKEQRKGKG